MVSMGWWTWWRQDRIRVRRAQLGWVEGKILNSMATRRCGYIKTCPNRGNIPESPSNQYTYIFIFVKYGPIWPKHFHMTYPKGQCFSSLYHCILSKMHIQNNNTYMIRSSREGEGVLFYFSVNNTILITL